MSLEHILLGLLREPASGYDLKACFDHSVRYFWAAELSQIYPTLKRMEKNGWLQSRLQPSPKGPKRRVYSLTAAGRKMLREWLLGEPQLGDERYGFVAQFFFMDAAGDWRETKRYVTALRHVLVERLETYGRIERDWLAGDPMFPDPDTPGGFHQLMALRGGLYHLSARVKWCDEVIQAVDERMTRSKARSPQRQDEKDKEEPMKLGRRTYVLITMLAALCAPTVVLRGGEPSFTRQDNLEVRMSDGVNLATNVYLPEGGTKFPTVLMRTPYNKNGMGWIAKPLAEAGYAVVVQDVRGQFGSEATFIPFVFEKKDGLETLDWVVKQPWCDGNVGMWGPSYLGYCALIVAPEAPPALKAIVNVAGWGDTPSITAPGGAMHLMVSLPWTLSGQISGGSAKRVNWDEAFRRTPVIEIPASLGIDSAQWKGAVQLYSSRNPDLDISIAGDFDKIDIPTFHLAGWYDFVGPVTIDTFEGLDRAARAGHKTFHKLLVGPWMHGQIYNGGTKIGEREFPDSINIGIDKLAEMSVQWFDQWLKGKDTGVTRERPVKLFVMGDDEWRSFDRWPPKNVRFESWYLASETGAAGIEGDGRLTRDKPGQGGADRFVYDPMDPVPTTGGANFHAFPDNNGIKDQREVEKRTDVLVYTTDVLERDTTIIGPVRAVLFASTEGRYTDFTAKLVDVRPDGYAANIVDAIKRGPDPIDGKDVVRMEPGKVYRFTVDMDATAISVKKGHRLRVEVSSSNFPKYTRNPNTGESAEYATEFVKVTQTVHHSPEYPSHVVLPMMP